MSQIYNTQKICLSGKLWYSKTETPYVSGVVHCKGNWEVVFLLDCAGKPCRWENHTLFLSGGFVLTPFFLFSWSLCTLEEGYGCYQKALHTQVVSHYCGLEQSKAQPSTAPSLGGTHCKASYTVDQDETGAISPRCPYSMPRSPPQEECGLSSWVWIPLLHTWLIFL